MGKRGKWKTRPKLQVSAGNRARPTPEPERSLAPTGQPAGGRADWAWAGALVAMVLLAYLPALRGGFVLDDADYVAENPLLLSLGGLWRIWTQGVPQEHYWPVTYTVFWIEHDVWGLAPVGYHLVNVLLHAANAALVWRVLTRMEVRGAWLAAAIFALHPVHVESVAWVIELKDVLSGLLYLLAFLAYATFAVEGRRRSYGLSLALFAAAMLSKSVVVTLPVAIGVWIWWKRGRLERRDVARLAPMLGVAVAMALVDIVLFRQIQPAHFDFSLVERLLVAGRALCFYAGKLLLPTELIPIYPLWKVDAGAAWQWLPTVAVAVALSLAVLSQRLLGRGPLAAALFFVATLLPMLGFVDFPFMEWSPVADRFQYLASIGPIALGVAGAARASEHLAKRPWAARAGGAGLLLTLGVLTWRQAGIYKNEETFYQAILARNPDAALAHNNLARLANAVDEGRGRTDEAIQHSEEAIRLKPNFALGHFNLAFALAARGQVDEAIQQYDQALRLKPDFVQAHDELANALASRGRVDEAIQHYDQALRLKPDFAEAHNNLALALAGRGRIDEAIQHDEEALRLKPDFAQAHNNLGNLLDDRGRTDEAIEHYKEALRLKPDFEEALKNLAISLARRRGRHAR
jgi:protein O-mannosyl-transferase